MKHLSFFLLLFFTSVAFISCNTSIKAEKSNSTEVTEATLDSVIVYYLDELDKGDNMIETTKENYEVLKDLEERLVFQLNNCLKDENLASFKEEEKAYPEKWQALRDSVVNANKYVTFEEGEQEKEMFLTWQYTYLLELRIIELLRIRDANCK